MKYRQLGTSAIRDSLFFIHCSCQTRLQKQFPSKTNHTSPALHAVSSMAAVELDQLLKHIDGCYESGFPEGQVKLMVYFDEAHILTSRDVPGDPDRKNMM